MTFTLTPKQFFLGILSVFILVGVAFTGGRDSAPVVHDTKTIQVSVPETHIKTRTVVSHDPTEKCKTYLDASLRILKIASDITQTQGELEALLDSAQKNLFEKDLKTQVKLQDQIKTLRYNLNAQTNAYGRDAVTMTNDKEACR